MGCGASTAAAPPPTALDETPVAKKEAQQPATGAPAPASSAPPKPLLKQSSSVRPNAVKANLKRRSVMVLMEEAQLEQAEAQSIVGVMTVPEMVQLHARVEAKNMRGSGADSESSKKLAPSGMHASEADAIVVALTPEELERTIVRAGLAVDDIVGDQRKLRTRASIALQHPNRALPVSASVGMDPAAQAEAELQARLSYLEELYQEEQEDVATTKIQAIWRGHHARDALPQPAPAEASERDEDAAASAPMPAMTFGGRAFSPSLLDEFMLTPGEFDEEITQDEWAEQLLLMWNDDRRAAGLPELQAEPWKDEPMDDPFANKPTLDKQFSSSAWLMWEEDPQGHSKEHPIESKAAGDPGAAAAGASDPDVKAFVDGLDAEAREKLDKLYEMGVLTPHDPLFKHTRYVKAMVASTKGM